ncbi:MAG: hypothetical protein AAGA95_00545 [Pseudomonadota bacterium]
MKTPSMILVVLLSGCSPHLLRTEESTSHYFCLGACIFSVPDGEADQGVSVLKSTGVGILGAGLHGTQINVGFSTMTQTALPANSFAGYVEISEEIGGPIAIKVMTTETEFQHFQTELGVREK